MRNREDVVDEATETEAPAITFEAPPTVTRSSGRDGVWDAKLQPLRDNAGQWANVTPSGVENPNSVANFLSSGKAKGVAETDFDFVSRTSDKVTNDKGKEVGFGHVYGIYLTDEQKEEKAEYDRISTVRRQAIKEAKSGLPDDASDEQKAETVKALELPELPRKSYLP